MKNYKYLIKWIGGKRILRKQIAKLIPDNINGYIEAFGGGGWVLFLRKNGRSLKYKEVLIKNY